MTINYKLNHKSFLTYDVRSKSYLSTADLFHLFLSSVEI